MRPREMVGEFLSLLGDPAAEKITEELALQLLNDAQESIANMLFPFYPSLFRTKESNNTADGSKNNFAIPAECQILERVILMSNSEELDGILLPLDSFGATVHNQFYSGEEKQGQVFYTHDTDNEILVSPVPNTKIWFYYRKRPSQMAYDYGKAVYQATKPNITDPSKNWANDEWERYTTYLTFPNDYIEADGLVTTNGETTLSISAAISGFSPGLYDYEVYVPSDIPDKFHHLIVREALALHDPTRAEQLKAEVREQLTILAGGR